MDINLGLAFLALLFSFMIHKLFGNNISNFRKSRKATRAYVKAEREKKTVRAKKWEWLDSAEQERRHETDELSAHTRQAEDPKYFRRILKIFLVLYFCGGLILWIAAAANYGGFVCDNENHIPHLFVNDDMDDCGDNSDEWGGAWPDTGSKKFFFGCFALSILIVTLNNKWPKESLKGENSPPKSFEQPLPPPPVPPPPHVDLATPSEAEKKTVTEISFLKEGEPDPIVQLVNELFGKFTTSSMWDSGPRVAIKPNIPQGKLSNVVSTYCKDIDPSEILLIFNHTVLRSYKHGFALTPHEFRFNGFASQNPYYKTAGSCKYSDISSVEVMNSTSHSTHIIVNGDSIINFAPHTELGFALAHFLNDVADLG